MAEKQEVIFNLNNQEDYCHKLNYLYRLGEYQGCLDFANRFLNHYPNDPEVKALKAISMIQLGQFEQVEQPLIDYLELPETLSRLDILYGLSVYYSSIKNYPVAASYSDALLFEYQNKVANIFKYKAELAEKNKNLDLSISHYQKTLAIKYDENLEKHLNRINPSNKIRFANTKNTNDDISEKISFQINDKPACVAQLIQLAEQLNASAYKKLVETFTNKFPQDLEYQCLYVLNQLKLNQFTNIEQPLLDFFKKPYLLDRYEIIYCLATYYIQTQQSEKALTYINPVLPKLEKYFSQIFFILANALQKNDQIEKSISFLIKSATLRTSIGIFVTLSSVYRFQCLFKKAIEWAEKGLSIYPQNTPITLEYASALKYVCNWQGESLLQNELLQASINAINKGESPCINPFLGIISIEDNQSNYKIAKQFALALQTFTPKLSNPFSFNNRNHKKIRIGFVGMSFKDHPVGRMTAKMYQYFDYDKFDIYCYSTALTDSSIYGKLIKDNCTQFRDVFKITPIETAMLIHQDEIDILIDLDCYLANNRMEVFTYKPAPIQINYLGFPGSSGADFMDYIIADEIIIPKDQQPFFSEKVLYMPDCYQMYCDYPDLELATVSKEQFDLPEGKFIFSCFNMPHKIDKRSFDAWLQILSAVPDSILWLFRLGDDLSPEQNLKQYAEKNKVDPDRIIFGKYAPKQIHLARIKLSDLMLDTFICNAHSTATDSLWVNVPVLTLQGKHFASRVCSSLLNYVGLKDMVAYNEQEYIDKAIELANNPELLANYQNILAETMPKTLSNTELTVRKLEGLFEAVYADFVGRGKPRPYN